MRGKRVLTERELELMEMMWDFGKPMRRNEMVDAISGEDISAAYISPVLNKLLDKGVIRVVDFVKVGNVFGRTYEPVIPREEYLADQLKIRTKGLSPESVSKVMMGALDDDESRRLETMKCMIASFVGDDEFSAETMDKLKKLIDGK